MIPITKLDVGVNFNLSLACLGGTYNNQLKQLLSFHPNLFFSVLTLYLIGSINNVTFLLTNWHVFLMWLECHQK